jgi:PPK2 family polyphosphate:nucleotide phosphotransferase
LDATVIEELTISSGGAANLEGRSTESTEAVWLNATGPHGKEVAKDDLRSFVEDLEASQELLWASGSHALLVILQGMDAAGKDGSIKHVMSGVNPQGCQVVAFKQPSAEELEHDFLWRYREALPERGMIGIFNRSYYEEVLVVRVHPELLGDMTVDSSAGSAERVWRDRYEDINAFEHHLHRNGTRIVKIFLHVSKEEQKNRLLERLGDPSKYWKFSMADLAERQHWDEYQAAHEETLTATSTQWAPWFIVPADHKYALRALVGGILVHAIDQLDLRPPKLGPDELESLAQARAELQAE